VPATALENVLALRIHLDDSTEFNGPLRVLPRTHLLGVLTESAVQALAKSMEPTECTVRRGGVLAMRPLLIHASSKSRDITSRRVLHIEYTASMYAGNGIELTVA